DEDFLRGTLGPGQRLVDHHPGVRQREPLSFSTGAEEHRAHARRLTHAVGRHVAGDELHGVVNRHARGDAPAGAVDVEADVASRILELEVEHLRDDQVRHVIVDHALKEDDSVLQESAVDVVGALFAAPALHYDRYKRHVYPSGRTAAHPGIGPAARG